MKYFVGNIDESGNKKQLTIYIYLAEQSNLGIGSTVLLFYLNLLISTNIRVLGPIFIFFSHFLL